MMKRWCVLCAVLPAIALTVLAQEEPTYAERLGWPTGSRVIMFHCDDAGMSHGQNQGAIKALEYGILTSVSTMMACPWVSEFAAYLEDHPEVDNGLHLTLTSEWTNYRWGPVAGKAAVPGLVDKQGCLWPNVMGVVMNASADEVETEIRTQIDRAVTLGIPITHLDTHMGTVYAKPEFLERYIKIGIEKQIPIMIMAGHMTWTKKSEPEAVERLQPKKLGDMVWNGGLPVLDDLLNETYGWKSFEEKKANTIKALRELKPGITMIIVHCAQPTEEWPIFTSSSETRLNDMKLMTDPDLKKVIEEEKLILTTWREMMERRKKAK